MISLGQKFPTDINTLIKLSIISHSLLNAEMTANFSDSVQVVFQHKLTEIVSKANRKSYATFSKEEYFALMEELRQASTKQTKRNRGNTIF